MKNTALIILIAALILLVSLTIAFNTTTQPTPKTTIKADNTITPDDVIQQINEQILQENDLEIGSLI